MPRHVVHTALLGQELAVWRADDGTVNAWENRCPHRGVRLSIGTNLGHALKCRYHGWTYESGSARCIAIPCHPRLTPAAAIRVRAYPCAERQGLVWVRLEGEGDGEDGIESGGSGSRGSGVHGFGSASGDDGADGSDGGPDGAGGTGRTGEPDGAGGAVRTEGPGGAGGAGRIEEPDGAGRTGRAEGLDGLDGTGRIGEPDGVGGTGGAGASGGVSDAGASPAGAEGRPAEGGRPAPDPTLRSVYVDAPAAAVAAAFVHYEGVATGPVRVEADAADPWTVHVLGGRDGDLRFMLQPLCERATVIHGVLAARTPRSVPASESAAVSGGAPASAADGPPPAASTADAPASADGPAFGDAPAFAADRLAVLRRHNAALAAVRDAAEKEVQP